MDPVLTVNEVAEILQLGPQRVRELLRSGQLSGFKLENSWRISRNVLYADLQKMNRLREGPVDAPAILDLHAVMSAPEQPLDAIAYAQPFAPLGADEGMDSALLEDAEAPVETFHLTVKVRNLSTYDGPFEIQVGAETPAMLAQAFGLKRLPDRSGYLSFSQRVAPEQTAILVDESVEGKLGYRLFITAPEQPACDVRGETAVVLRNDTQVLIALGESGVVRKKRSVRFRRTD